MKKIIFVVVCLIIIMIFTHCICSPSEEYQPKLYTKEELLTVYEVNKTLFQDVVNVIIHNENFCNDRDSEYDDSLAESAFGSTSQLLAFRKTSTIPESAILSGSLKKSYGK